MRCNARIIIAIAIAFLLTLLLLSNQHGEHVRTFFYSNKSDNAKSQTSETAPTPDDKIIIMGKLTRENTDWVAGNLPDWQSAIYTVDSPLPFPTTTTTTNTTNTTTTTLRTPQNKGHESLVYLTYIIENYPNFPSILAFIHPHRGGYWHYWSSWHTDTQGWDNVISLNQLKLDYVKRQGYVNLRCNWKPGCRVRDRRNKHVTGEIWGELFPNGTGVHGLSMRNGIDDVGGVDSDVGNGDDISEIEEVDETGKIPSEIGAACCAQFAVSSTQILKRPKEDYERYRDWILDTGLSDAKSGRVMEFLWHVIFGREAVFCPLEKTCYCQVYGRC